MQTVDIVAKVESSKLKPLTAASHRNVKHSEIISSEIKRLFDAGMRHRSWFFYPNYVGGK